MSNMVNSACLYCIRKEVEKPGTKYPKIEEQDIPRWSEAGDCVNNEGFSPV